MANSKEVELVLHLNAANAETALANLRNIASKKSDTEVRRVLESHADQVGELAARTIEKTMNHSNRQFASLMVTTADQAAQAMSKALEQAWDERLTATERKKAMADFQKQKDSFASLDEKDVAEVLTRGWTSSLKDGRTYRALYDTILEAGEKALNNIDASDLIEGFKKAGAGGSDILKGMAETKNAQSAAAAAAGDAAGAEALAAAGSRLGMMAAGLTAVVGALALFAMWTKAADDAQKKMNTSILEGAGASDFVSRSFDTQTGKAVDLTATLGSMRNAAYEVAQQFRFADAEDATKVLSELNQAGVTYKEIAGDITSAIGKQEAFEDALVKTISRSRMLGVSTGEVAEYQNTLMTELGYSMDTMGDVFGDISNAAERAGVSTKSMFTAVSQATSGMALYSVRISEAIGFLEGFSKALGEQDVKKFVEGLGKGPSGAAEALRDVVVASKADPQALVGAFRDATGELIEDFGKKFADRKGAAQKAFQDAGFSPETADALFSSDKATRESLATMIANMSEEQRLQLQHGLPDEMAREFQKIAQLSQGTKADIGAQGAAYFAATPALRMEMLDKMTDFFGGTGEARGDARIRAAFEATTGKSGEDLTMLFNVIDQVQGQLLAIERVRAGKGTDSDVASLKEAGFTVDADKRSVTRGGEEIRDRADIYRTMDEINDLTSKGQTEQEKQAEKMYKSVNSIFNVLNTEIKQALFESNTILDDMFSADNSGEAAASRQRRAEARQASERREKLGGEATRKSETAAAAEKAATSGKARTPEEQRKLEEEATKARSEAYEAQKSATKAALEAKPFGYESWVWDAGIFDGELDELPSQPGALQSKLQPFVQSGGPAGKALQEALIAYEEAYADRDANYNDAGRELKYGLAANHHSPLIKARKSVIEALNTMEMGYSFSDELSSDGIQIKKIEDAFISDGVMYRPHAQDNALFYKDGGPMDPARMAGGGGGGNVVININGGDQAMVYRTVARAMRAAQG